MVAREPHHFTINGEVTRLFICRKPLKLFSATKLAHN
jgi:hypothetical protein